MWLLVSVTAEPLGIKTKVQDMRELLASRRFGADRFSWMEIPETAKCSVIKLGLLLWPLLLAGLVFSACSPAQDALATPSPGPTAGSATTASGATPLPAQLEELEISSKGAVLRVSLKGLPETVADLVRSLDSVTIVEKYLIVLSPNYPDPFIGVGPGSIYRVEDSVVSLVAGEDFQSGEQRVAIPGFGVNSSSYSGGAMSNAAMAHRFMAGQSFEVDGTRLRVVGLFRAPSGGPENAILLPLTTAQEIFDLHGELTDIFVTVDSKDKLESVAAEIRNILVVAYR